MAHRQQIPHHNWLFLFTFHWSVVLYRESDISWRIVTKFLRCKMMEPFCEMNGGLIVSFSGFWSRNRVFCEMNEGLIVSFSGF